MNWLWCQFRKNKTHGHDQLLIFYLSIFLIVFSKFLEVNFRYSTPVDFE
uniref:Uncharacterized protein n=1 Tax=Setaria italica TaxID=4555 RepID=K4AN71_SETIT